MAKSLFSQIDELSAAAQDLVFAMQAVHAAYEIECDPQSAALVYSRLSDWRERLAGLMKGQALQQIERANCQRGAIEFAGHWSASYVMITYELATSRMMRLNLALGDIKDFHNTRYRYAPSAEDAARDYQDIAKIIGTFQSVDFVRLGAEIVAEFHRATSDKEPPKPKAKTSGRRGRKSEEARNVMIAAELSKAKTKDERTAIEVRLVETYGIGQKYIRALAKKMQNGKTKGGKNKSQ